MTKLFLAVDNLQDPKVRNVAEKLATTDLNFGIKLNLDYFLFFGIYEAIRRVTDLTDHGRRPIFGDIKMLNGGRTMADIVHSLAQARIEFLNIHALADKEIRQAVDVTKGSKTRILGVTVLSHYDEAYCLRHFRRPVGDAVQHLAQTAIDAGCHGIILPGTTLNSVRHLKTVSVATGVRPDWYHDARHEQEVTPAVAKERGASWVVCGSPIMKSQDPVAALRRVLNELQ